MNYLLTCAKCNTNLKDFNYINKNNNICFIYCKCKPDINHVTICSGFYIDLSNYSFRISNYDLNINVDYYNDSITFNRTKCKLHCTDPNVLELNDYQNKLELIDKVYELYLKYKNNQIFI
jgi:hypothetical protein